MRNFIFNCFLNVSERNNYKLNFDIMLLGVCACISLSGGGGGKVSKMCGRFLLAQKRLWIFSPNSQNKVFRICPNFWWRCWPQNVWLWRHNGGVKNGDFSILRSDMVEWYLKWKVWTQRLQIWFCFISVTSSRDVIIGKLLQNTYFGGLLLVH